MTQSDFKFLGFHHIIVLMLTVVIPLALSALVRRVNSHNLTRTVRYTLGVILLGNDIVHLGYRFIGGEFNLFLRYFLPLHVCGLATFATAATLLFQIQTLYEFAYFWGLVGTFNAVLTPQLEVGFPNYRAFQYFIAHSGIVIGVLFSTLGLQMRPSLRSLFRSFAVINLLALVIGGFNYLASANYMFLCEPPKTKFPVFNPESPLFIRWPLYIPILDVLALILFFVVYSPFLIRDWRRRTAGNADFGNSTTDCSNHLSE